MTKRLADGRPDIQPPVTDYEWKVIMQYQGNGIPLTPDKPSTVGTCEERMAYWVHILMSEKEQHHKEYAKRRLTLWQSRMDQLLGNP